MKKKIAAVTAALALAFSLSACDGLDKMQEPFKDAPVGNRDVNGPADVINMPDGFSNVAAKCDKGHGVRVYVLFKDDKPYGSIAAVADPSCK